MTRCMTAKLVKNMTDSDLLDMHYFLTEDDDHQPGGISYYIKKSLNTYGSIPYQGSKANRRIHIFPGPVSPFIPGKPFDINVFVINSSAKFRFISQLHHRN